MNLPNSEDAHLILVWAVITLALGLPALVAAIVAAYNSVHARREATAANDAVNHRHLYPVENGEHPPKLYDALLNTRQRVGEVAEHLETLMLDVNHRFSAVDDALKRNDEEHQNIKAMIRPEEDP